MSDDRPWSAEEKAALWKTKLALSKAIWLLEVTMGVDLEEVDDGVGRDPS